jgi:membrane-bound lytic murein transglycosylase B
VSSGRTRPRWLGAALVVSATAAVLASSCSWQTGSPIPEGVPPPAGEPVPAINTHAHGRPAAQLREWAEQRAPALGIPIEAMEAYGYATRVAQVENPDCHLAWTTLAGIGMVESHHGTYRGALIAPNGDVSPPIRGVRLDGTNGNLEIIDREASQRAGDGDPVYARAMGPMQFIPETWRLYGVDANNDGVISPDNFDDAALSAAGYLCFRGKDLSTPRGWMNALRAYNHSDLYARTVRDWAAAYAAGHPL